MPIEFTVNDQQKFYTCRLSGVLDDQQVYDAWVNFYESKHWPEGYLELMDLSGIIEARLTPSGIQRVAEYRISIHRLHAVAQNYLVFAPTDLTHGLCRMYHTYSGTSVENIKFAKTQAEVVSYIETYAAELKITSQL